MLGLGVAGEMLLNAFGEETFAAALTAPRQGRTSTFSAHAGAKSVLAFAGAFRSLKGAFHSRCAPGGRSGYVREQKELVNQEGAARG